MRQHNDISTQSKTKAWQQYKADHRLLWLPPLVVLIVLALGTLSCAFFEIGSSSASGAVATRTAWPTFTPTAASPPVVVALVVESADAAPTLPPPPVNTAAAPAASAATPSPLPTPISTPAAAAEPGQASGSTDTSAASSSSTPADAFTATLAAMPTDAPTAAPTEAPTSTSPPAVPAAPNPNIETSGWSFAHVQAYTSPYEDSLLVYGDVINDTGVGQELGYISGAFYNAQGQIIADDDSVRDYWTIDVVPPGERVPFRLTVDGIQSTAKFSLKVVAEPSDEIPRQDFEFLDLNPSNEAGEYCVAGRLQNPGDVLRYNLTIVVALYDGQDKMLNFGDYREPNPDYVVGDETLDFRICVEDLNQSIARYELRAWGE